MSGPARGPEAGGRSPAGLRALVVDDEPPLVKVVATYLEREGFEVASAGDGERAVALARELNPDVIVLDLMLPGIDGTARDGNVRRAGNPITVSQCRSASASATAAPGEHWATSSAPGWCSPSAGNSPASPSRPSTSPTSPWPSRSASPFQYFSIAPMRGLGPREGIIAALKADTLSLTAVEVGLFGWMALIQLVLFTAPHLKPDHAAYWFLMQVGMVLGFATAYPVNVWLIRRGVKEAM